MPKIQIMPIELANQIAAGEVIERPASVLKELLENSLDAGSQVIQIRIEQGGQTLIKVQDDGHGIAKEELILALSPHATSKISNLYDLENVLSYGFRGEALASLSSVARLKVSSKTAAAPHAWQIRVAGRLQTEQIQPEAHPLGTTIEVKDLFFNTPARRKFLKSEKTEYQHIENILKRIALARMDVEFKLYNQDKLAKHLPACKANHAINRLQALCGQNFVDNVFGLNCEANGLKLTGWFSNHDYARAYPDIQFFYVNRRLIKDRGVNHAIRMAYEGICPVGRYPAYIMYLELDPQEVDVNVHPSKSEVRFRDARSLYAFIVHAITEAMKKTTHLVLAPANKLEPINELKSQLPSKVLPAEYLYDRQFIGQMKNGQIFISDSKSMLIELVLKQMDRMPAIKLEVNTVVNFDSHLAQKKSFEQDLQNALIANYWSIDLVGPAKGVLRSMPGIWQIFLPTDFSLLLNDMLQILADKKSFKAFYTALVLKNWKLCKLSAQDLVSKINCIEGLNDTKFTKELDINALKHCLGFK